VVCFCAVIASQHLQRLAPPLALDTRGLSTRRQIARVLSGNLGSLYVSIALDVSCTRGFCTYRSGTAAHYIPRPKTVGAAQHCDPPLLMWRASKHLLPCTRFRLLKLGQGAVAAVSSPATHPRAASEASMTSFAHTGAPSSKPVFCDFPLDRAGHLRDDPHMQEKLSSSDNAKLVVLNGAQVLCQAATKDAPEALAVSKLTPLREYRSNLKEPLLFLGISQDGAPYFAAQASDANKDNFSKDVMSWVDIRSRSGDFTSADSSLAATAHGVLAWHQSSTYSEETGKELVAGHGGWARMEDSNSKCALLCTIHQ
jgi:hypothetical protein